METNKIRSIAISLFLIFFSLFVYTKLAGPIPFSVNSVNTNKAEAFTVDGRGEATAVPDKARINIGISESSSGLTEAKNRLSTKTEELIGSLTSLGIKKEDIRTTNYSINPEYSTSQRVSGYNITQTFEVNLPIETLNEVVDKAVASGANLSSGIEFVLDDDKQIELEEKARKEAIENAKKKAQSIASAAGIRLGRIINIQESSDNFPRPLFAEAKSDQLNEATPSSNITPGQNTIEIVVTVSFETN